MTHWKRRIYEKWLCGQITPSYGPPFTCVGYAANRLKVHESRHSRPGRLKLTVLVRFGDRYYSGGILDCHDWRFEFSEGAEDFVRNKFCKIIQTLFAQNVEDNTNIVA